MLNDREEIQALLDQERWSEEDIQRLLEYIDQHPHNEFQTILQQRFLLRLQEGYKGHSERAALLLKDIHEKMGMPENSVRTTHRILFLRTAWFRYAAAVLILLSTVAYLWRVQTVNKDIAAIPAQGPAQNTIQPGGNKATLTLSDGKIIVLDSAANGAIALEGAATISKKANGEILYASGSNEPRPATYNTMTTPRGGQYQLTLSDGTRVWLNAASSITYPSSFTEKERNVSVSGELYFEVAKNADRPFKVSVNGGAEIEVLGTHFNVNAYADDQVVKTTLLEGSVLVAKDNHRKTLKPGQQAQLTASAISISNADTSEVMAWRNGWFQFRSQPIEEIMRQIGRWYDIEVTYTGKSQKRHFSGIVSRSSGISEVLKIMEVAGVTFRIEGKKISVAQ